MQAQTTLQTSVFTLEMLKPFRVSLSGGVPQVATQVYGNAGQEIAGASIAVSAGKRLLIGSSLDDKLLDCTAN